MDPIVKVSNAACDVEFRLSKLFHDTHTEEFRRSNDVLCYGNAESFDRASAVAHNAVYDAILSDPGLKSRFIDPILRDNHTKGEK